QTLLSALGTFVFGFGFQILWGQVGGHGLSSASLVAPFPLQSYSLYWADYGRWITDYRHATPLRSNRRSETVHSGTLAAAAAHRHHPGHRAGRARRGYRNRCAAAL